MKKFLEQIHTRTYKEKGFALLIGVVISSILISITFIMFNITLKQVTLATSGKNSQIALYAADTGIECGLYADLRITDEFSQAVTTANSDGTYYSTTFNTVTPKPFKCNGGVINNGNITTVSPVSITARGVTDNNAISYSFYVHYPNNEQSCARVTITYYRAQTTPQGTSITVEQKRTKVESRGYNTCPDPSSFGYIANDPQRLERGLDVYY
jgi:hypothetical protein